MSKSLLFCNIILSVAVLIFAHGCLSPERSEVKLNDEFTLAPGEKVTVVDADLQIKFLRVTEDSRCPEGATCIWAGQVSCMVEITSNGASKSLVLTESGLLDEYSTLSYGYFTLSYHVTPYPKAGTAIPENSYRLHLIISRALSSSKIISP